MVWTPAVFAAGAPKSVRISSMGPRSILGVHFFPCTERVQMRLSGEIPQKEQSASEREPCKPLTNNPPHSPARGRLVT